MKSFTHIRLDLNAEKNIYYVFSLSNSGNIYVGRIFFKDKIFFEPDNETIFFHNTLNNIAEAMRCIRRERYTKND